MEYPCAYVYKQSCKTMQGTDVLFPRIGEIIGGSVREESYEKLVEEIETRGMKRDIYDWYLDTRKYGTCPLFLSITPSALFLLYEYSNSERLTGCPLIVIIVGAVCPYAIVVESKRTDRITLNFIIILLTQGPSPLKNRKEGE